jgi:PTH1 family peptidyl-tRNA hydrolase
VKLIAGLGNPGPRYADSRHNIGFMVAEALGRRWSAGAARYERRWEALEQEALRGGRRVLLLRPQTFMNLSGRSVAAVWRFYKLPAEDLLVIHDDLDLPVGQLRLRAGGSAGGHKGMDDVIRHVGTDAIARVRIGIGKVHPSATTEYVLGRFAPDERPLIEEAIERAADAVECWLARGIETAMNEFNRRRGAGPPERPATDDSRSEGESS